MREYVLAGDGGQALREADGLDVGVGKGAGGECGDALRDRGVPLRVDQRLPVDVAAPTLTPS